MTRSAKSTQTETPKPPARTPGETALVEEWKASRKDRIRSLCMKAGKTTADNTRVTPDHPGGDAVWSALMMRSMGTKNERAAEWLLNMLINAAVPGGGSQPLSELDLNGVLSMLQEIAPRDEIEAMLVSQMAATHMV